MIEQSTRLLFERIRRRLDRWELGHLRDHSALQAARIARQKRLIETLKSRVRNAEDDAYNAWHMLEVERMVAEQDRDQVVAITRDGRIGLVDRPVEWHPC
ncbi:MAG: hypothetical protein EOP37_03340 [Rubrivivax sp.]|nr:MAG: hypothetical protein EOP37_03340 [Rubrivivax sp.]